MIRFSVKRGTPIRVFLDGIEYPAEISADTYTRGCSVGIIIRGVSRGRGGVGGKANAHYDSQRKVFRVVTGNDVVPQPDRRALAYREEYTL